jgi:hypothetical protein
MLVTSAKTKVLGLVLSVATISSTLAISRHYDVGGVSVLANQNSNDGLAITTTPVPNHGNVQFDLNNGQSYQFDLFTIQTDETKVDLDDWKPKTITATLDFDVPDSTAQIEGLTISGTLFGYSGGLVLWFDPVVVNAVDRAFSVNLSEAFFDLGKGGFGNSPATIKATVTQLSSYGSTAVPEAGATVVLLGIGGLVLVAGRKLTG